MLLDGVQWTLEQGLEALTVRHQLLADNIANLDTPNFKRSDVSFRRQLAQALNSSSRLPLRATHENHLGTTLSADHFQPRIVTDNSTTMRADGNNVDVDREMAELARNTVAYTALTDLTSRQLGRLRLAITEGRR